MLPYELDDSGLLWLREWAGVSGTWLSAYPLNSSVVSLMGALTPNGLTWTLLLTCGESMAVIAQDHNCPAFQ